MSTLFRSILMTLIRHLSRLGADQRGNVAVMMAFLLPPLFGALGVGFEVGNWYLITRAMQNAADSAAIAAASNGTSNYAAEAKAVAAQYGYVDGTNNVTVAASNTAACPGGGNTCYSVTITSEVSLFLAQVVGYQGNALVNGAPGQALSAASVANQSSKQVPLCLLALGTSGAQDIVTNGNPKANMTGCNVMANTSARCNGGNLNAPYGLAHNTDSGCGVIQVSGVPAVTDPYASLASNIPANAINSCGGSFPQEPAKHNDPALPSSNQWSAWPPPAATNLGNNVYVVCGDQQLSGTVTVDIGASAVLIVENGQLDTGNGNTLRTAAGSGLTIVFSGTNGGSYVHAPTGGGTLDMAAPTSGPWSGVALYQDPNLTTGVSISAAGNSPTWKITGLVYLPHSTITLSGSVNKSSAGQACFVMVMDSITINGTGDVVAGDTPENCAKAGLKMPQATVPSRGQLVS
jgi:Flp pilus assembly protein TadG